MTFDILKVLHIGSMFMATALAVGPLVVMYLVARTQDVAAIARTFSFSTSIGRIGGVMYGLGILFGVMAALSGALDLTAPWLLTAYVLVILLGVNGVLAERWIGQVERAAEASQTADLQRLAHARSPIVSLTIMIGLTLAIIFVMVVKPTLV
jgi:uncharacterized membrane protein